MRQALLGAGLLLGLATSLPAQNGREFFVQKDTAYDAVHAAQRDAFTVLRDSTSGISAATSRFLAGVTSQSSLAWMQGRARTVADACARTVAPLANARAVTAGERWPHPSQQQAQAELLKDMTTLGGQLAECRKNWTSLATDSSQVALREHAPYELRRLDDQLSHFNRAAQKYLQRIAVKLPTPGTTAP